MKRDDTFSTYHGKKKLAYKLQMDKFLTQTKKAIQDGQFALLQLPKNDISFPVTPKINLAETKEYQLTF